MKTKNTVEGLEHKKNFPEIIAKTKKDFKRERKDNFYLLETMIW